MKNRLLTWGIALAMLFLGGFYALTEGSRAETVRGDRVYCPAGTEEAGDPAEGYIRKMLYPVRPAVLRVKRPAGAGLTGANQALYSCLMAGIQAVAAGEETSTVFSCAAEEIYPQTQFTAEDLGVPSLIEDDEISAEALARIGELRSSVDIGRILTCLLADAPYELYWFDKSEETGGLYITYPADIVYDENTETLSMTGNLVVEMIVAGEYAADTSGECFEVDPKYGAGVTAAAANARAIADAHEDDPDYDRLLAYKDEICSRVSYYDGDEAAYGNPWQLIWVFDDDPETNVLCEGYAKAFQYLNDLSGTPDVSVISVTGLMNGENHMWNIVNMDNGRNYLTDVTNCDSSMVGYPDKLFLTGCSEGSAAEGYTCMAGDYPVTYLYRDNAYPEADLEIRDKSYLESLALKPDTPAYSLSSETGYAGYRCAVRMDEAYDCVHIQETGETVIPDSEGLFFISSRVIGEEDMAFTIAAEREGFVSPYGETLILRAEEKPEDGGLLFPDSLTEIREEAFRGTGIISVTVPERIQTIGDFAFADNPSLLFAELNGQELGQGVFDNCPLALFCIDEENAGMFFEEGKAFLVKHRD